MLPMSAIIEKYFIPQNFIKYGLFKVLELKYLNKTVLIYLKFSDLENLFGIAFIIVKLLV